jgi:hypothetical protein
LRDLVDKLRESALASRNQHEFGFSMRSHSGRCEADAAGSAGENDYLLGKRL